MHCVNLLLGSLWLLIFLRPAFHRLLQITPRPTKVKINTHVRNTHHASTTTDRPAPAPDISHPLRFPSALRARLGLGVLHLSSYVGYVGIDK